MNPLAIIEILAERFPATFFVFEQRRRPLKLGIHLDVLAALGDAITPEGCAAAMRAYCANDGYLLACTAGAARIDLHGNIVGQVSAEEAAHAKQRLAQQQAKQDRQKQAAGHALERPAASAACGASACAVFCAASATLPRTARPLGKL
jgi:ProP effector